MVAEAVTQRVVEIVLGCLGGEYHGGDLIRLLVEGVVVIALRWFLG